MKKFFGFLFLLLGVPSFLCGGVMVGEAARNGFREVGGVILLIGIPVGLGFGGLMLFIASRLLKQKQKQPPQDDSQNDPH